MEIDREREREAAASARNVVFETLVRMLTVMAAIGLIVITAIMILVFSAISDIFIRIVLP